MSLEGNILRAISMRIIFYCVYPLINRLYQCEEMIMRITHLQKSIPLREILQPPNHAINTCLRRVAKLLLKFQQGIPVKGIVVVDICRDDILLISIQKKPDMFFYKTRLLLLVSPQELTGLFGRQETRLKLRHLLLKGANFIFKVLWSMIIKQA